MANHQTPNRERASADRGFGVREYLVAGLIETIEFEVLTAQRVTRYADAASSNPSTGRSCQTMLAGHHRTARPAPAPGWLWRFDGGSAAAVPPSHAGTNGPAAASASSNVKTVACHQGHVPAEGAPIRSPPERHGPPSRLAQTSHDPLQGLLLSSGSRSRFDCRSRRLFGRQSYDRSCLSWFRQLSGGYPNRDH